jgi:hypothetical protein
LPAAPTATWAEKLKRSGASAQTLAPLPGKRLVIVTLEGSRTGGAPAATRLPAELVDPPAPAAEVPPWLEPPAVELPALPTLPAALSPPFGLPATELPALLGAPAVAPGAPPGPAPAPPLALVLPEQAQNTSASAQRCAQSELEERQ